MNEPENPPAFPRTGEGFGNPRYDAPGMTLRDWFAGQCLASAAALPLGSGDCAYRAARCYEMADAMLSARTTPDTAERTAR